MKSTSASQAHCPTSPLIFNQRILSTKTKKTHQVGRKRPLSNSMRERDDRRLLLLRQRSILKHNQTDNHSECEITAEITIDHRHNSEVAPRDDIRWSHESQIRPIQHSQFQMQDWKLGEMEIREERTNLLPRGCEVVSLGDGATGFRKWRRGARLRRRHLDRLLKNHSGPATGRSPFLLSWWQCTNRVRFSDGVPVKWD